jgi:hypothetical protein
MNQETFFNVPGKPNDFTLGNNTSRQEDSIVNSLEQSVVGENKINNKNLENYINRMENRGKTNTNKKSEKAD